MAGLIAIVTTSVLAQYDQLARSVSRAVNDITNWLEGQPFNLSLGQATTFNRPSPVPGARSRATSFRASRRVSPFSAAWCWR